MADLISQFGTIATAIFTQIGTVASTIVSTPLLLFTTGFLFLGGCVGIFGRLLSRNQEVPVLFLTEVAPSAMGNLIKDFGTIASAIFAQVSEVAETIVSTPLLLFTTGFLFLGGCVGIFGRLLSRN